MGAPDGEKPDRTTRQSDDATGGFVSLSGGRFLRGQPNAAKEAPGAASSDGPLPSPRADSKRATQSPGEAGPPAKPEGAATEPVGVSEQPPAATGVAGTAAHKDAAIRGARSPSRAKRSRGRGSDWAIPVLLGIVLACGVGAYLFYPRRTPVYRPAPLIIIVKLQNAQISGADAAAAVTVQMWVEPTKKRDVDAVKFAVVYHTLRTSPTPPLAGISIVLPPGSVARSCTELSGNQCSTIPIGAGSGPGAETYPTGGSDNVWAANLNFMIKSPGLTWNANGLNAEAQMPIVKGFSYNGSGPVAPLNGDTQMTMTYRVPDAGTYDWTPPPLTNSSLLGAQWSEPLSAVSGPPSIPITGIDGAASGSDSVRTLVVGVLLGIVGAGLVGLVQELAHRKE